jgi:tetratricopeptide (TPR) repeat protein
MSADTKPLQSSSRQLATLAVLAFLLVLAGFSLWSGLESLRWGWRLDQGKSWMAEHDPEKAFPLLDRCARDNTSSAEAAFLAGRAARMTQRLAVARQWLDQARGRGWAPTAVELEQALLGLQGGAVEPYLAFVEKCLEVDQPDRPRILEVLTGFAYQRLDLSTARAHAQAWVDAEPDNPAGWAWLGTIDARQKNHNKAIESFRKAIEINPESVNAIEGLALALRKVRQPEEALTLARKLEFLAPGRLGLDRLIGACLAELGRTEEALKVLQNDLAMHPEDNETRVELARLHLAAARSADARKVLEPALARAPFDREALDAMANAMEQQGERNEADKMRTRLESVRRDLKLADGFMADIGKDPRAVAPRLALAELLWKNGMPGEAARWAESVLVLDKSNATALVLLDRIRSR